MTACCRADRRCGRARVFGLDQRRRLPMRMDDEQPVVIAGARAHEKRAIRQRRDALCLADVHRRNRAEALGGPVHVGGNAKISDGRARSAT